MLLRIRQSRRDIIFKGIREFWDTPTPILVIKLTLSLGVIVLCLLSIFLNGKLLGYGMAGLGLLVLTYGIESKIKNQENLTLIFGMAVAILFFVISRYIITNPFL